MIEKCCITSSCTNPADGLDDDYCQDCWELICDKSFCDFVQQSEAVGLLDQLEKRMDAPLDQGKA